MPDDGIELYSDHYCRDCEWSDGTRCRDPTIERDIHINTVACTDFSQIQVKFDRRLEISLPENHFISEYVQWLSSISDGYKDYQILCALWILSAVTQGRVALRLKQEVIKPNIWGICVGQSTTSRKSTIVNKTRKVYEVAAETTLYNDDYSIEGYLETLSEHPISNHVRDEAAGLFAKFHKKYNEGIFEAECAIYDCQNYKKTLASGKDKKPKTYEINNPFVTKLYATTPDNLARYMTIDDFLSGYGYRLIYALPNYKHDRKPLEVETQEDVEAWSKILSRTRTLAHFFNQFSGDVQFKIEPEAMKIYNQVIQEIEDKAESLNNGMLNSAIGRSQVHILKIAMLIELGKAQVSTTITTDSVITASEMVIDYFLPSLMEVIDRLQEDVKFNKIEKIRSILRRLGGIATHTKLLRDSHLTSKEFQECIETMIESCEIDIISEEAIKLKKYKLNNHNKPLEVRISRKVRNVRLYTQSNNNDVNNANKNKEVNNVNINIRARVITPSPTDSDIICEPCELCERSELDILTTLSSSLENIKKQLNKESTCE